MTIENDPEKLDNAEEMPALEIERVPDNNTPQHEERLRHALAERFSKLEKIKSDIPPKTYQQVFEKIKREEQEILEQFQKESQERQEREKVTQILPKAYFEQRFLRVKEIRID